MAAARWTRRREFGRTRSERLPDCRRAGIHKRLPMWHAHIRSFTDPRPRRRSPGFRRERSGLSHFDDLHTTMYNETLPARSTLAVYSKANSGRTHGACGFVSRSSKWLKPLRARRKPVPRLVPGARGSCHRTRLCFGSNHKRENHKTTWPSPPRVKLSLSFRGDCLGQKGK